MNKQKQKIMAMLLIVAMLFTFVPTAALAEGEAVNPYIAGAFTITLEDGVTSGSAYTYAENVLTITTSSAVTIANTTPDTSTKDRIVVADGVNANITLAGVNIDVSGINLETDQVAAFQVNGGQLTLTIKETNTLKSGITCAGLQLDGSSLVITGESTGTLIVQGGTWAAGIGTGYEKTCNNIAIAGGFIEADAGAPSDGSWKGPGIGAGYSGICGDVQITGGQFSEASLMENTVCGTTVADGYYVNKTGTGNFPYVVSDTKPAHQVSDGNQTELDITRGDIIIADGEVIVGGISATFDIDGFVITSNNTSTANTVLIKEGSHKITINNLNIDVSNQQNVEAFNVEGGSHLNLTLKGTNSLTSGRYCAGLNLADGSSLTITELSDGSLTAIGGEASPGIGSANGHDNSSAFTASPCGDITIKGGTIYAKPSKVGSIGPGYNNACGNITITGGTIHATENTAAEEGFTAAGIGAVTSGVSCGDITITGGTVIAKDIGNCGNQNNKETVINISGGNIQVSGASRALGHDEAVVTITGGNFASGVEATDSDSGKVYDNVVASCHKVVKNDTGGYPYAVVEGEHKNIYWDKTNTTHKQLCNSCKVVIVAEEAHEWTGNDCSECGYICNHTGGTATCIAKAVCTECKQPYGELADHKYDAATCLAPKTCTVCNTTEGEKDAANHVSANFTYTTNNDGTHKKVHECGVEVNAKETCSYGSDNVCDNCGYTKPESKPSTGGGFSGSYNYPVSTPAVDNGSVKLSDNNASAGEKVTATVKPDNGYGVAEVIVTDEKGNIIPVTMLGNGEYSFVMPAGKVNIETVCKPAITLTVGNENANVFGKTVKNDVAPVIRDNRTMLPIRFIAEALDGDVMWNAKTQSVTIVKDGDVIEIFIGKGYAMVNGKRVSIDSPAFIENNRTYLPVRFVSEALGATVNWDAAAQQVVIMK